MPSAGGDKLCPICDSPLQPGSKKCGFCGTDLSIFDMDFETSKPEPSPPAKEQPQKPSVESRMEEIFSKPLVPEKPAPGPEPPIEKVSAPTVEETHEPEVAETEPVSAPAEAPPSPAPEVKKEVEEEAKFFECPQCGSNVPMAASSCPKCGVMFAEEGAEMFQCPACNTLVNIDAKSCPGCGALFVEPEEAAAGQAPAEEAAVVEPEVEAAAEMEQPMAEVRQPEPVAEEEKPAEKKGLLKWFKRGKEEAEAPIPEDRAEAEPEPVEEPRPDRRPEKSFFRERAVRPETTPEQAAAPSQGVIREARPEEFAPAVAPGTCKDRGRDLARMVAEMKPLLALARERDIDIGDSKQLIDDAAVAGRDRQLEQAIALVEKSKVILMSKVDSSLAQSISQLNDEIRVAREFGGDISRPSSYVQEVARARASADVESAFVFVDKAKKELLPITGRYNEARKKLSTLKQLIADCEAFSVDTKEARSLLVDADRAFGTKDFDRMEGLVKAATEKLYKAIPARMNEEMKKARDQLIEAKVRNMNITPMITVLKSATNLMKSGDYAQALREMREFRELVRKTSKSK